MVHAALQALVFAAVGVHTSTSDVRACALEDERAVAATGGGLAIVDGGETTVLTRLDGLPGTQVDALARDGEGSWWVGTEGGLARVEIGADRVEVLDAIEGPAIRAIGVDPTGVLVGTWGHGVMRLEDGWLRALEREASDGGASRRITVMRRHDDAWLVGTAGAGVWRVDGEHVRPTGGLDDALVWSLASDGERLWVGTLEGLYRGTDELRRTSLVDARGVSLVGDDVVVATLGDGLQNFDATSGEAGRVEAWSGLSLRGVGRAGGRRCVATDDGLWLDHGPGTEAVRRLDDGLPSRDVSAVAFDGRSGRAWVGTFDGGLAFRDGERWHRVGAEELDPQINAVAVDADGVAWVGTARGLTRIEGDSVRRLGRKDGIPHEHVLSVLPRRDGSVVVGTARGFVTVKGGKVVRPERELGAGKWAVWAMAEDGDGTLWLGTTVGLIEWPTSGAWTRHSMLDGTLPDNWVTAVVPDDDGLWVGTYAGGVVRLTSDGSAELGGGRINPSGLTLDGGWLYASTMGGLLRRRVRGGEWKRMDDVLLGKDTKAVLRADDGLWVATRRGISVLRS